MYDTGCDVERDSADTFDGVVLGVLRTCLPRWHAMPGINARLASLVLLTLQSYSIILPDGGPAPERSSSSDYASSSMRSADLQLHSMHRGCSRQSRKASQQ